MKKNTTTKKTNVKRASAARNNAKVAAVKKINSDACKQCFNPWSLSIYIYWFIILFFIAAAFYILGRSQGILTNMPKAPVNADVTEEILLQANDYYESGKTKLMAGEIDDAIADLSAAIGTNDATIDAYILRGEAYMQSGNYKAALADFDTAIANDPHNASAYYDRALLNTRAEDYSAALNDINNALAAQAARPTPALQMRDLYAKRGQLNLWLKNWDGAIADYTNSLARPEGTVSATVYAERAEAYTAKNMFAEAINDYTSAIRVISEQIQATQTPEEVEKLQSDAMSYFEKSAALNLSLGNVDGARADLESAYTIAMALTDTPTMNRLRSLMSDLTTVQQQAQQQ